MNHANHAPDTHRDSGSHDAPPAVPANFTYVRVKTSDSDSDDFSPSSAVPLNFAAGITAKLRAYRETPDQTAPSLEYQVAPTEPVLTPPLVPDQSPTPDPLLLKDAYVGRITVNVPGGEARTLKITRSHTDAVHLDLTKGVEVRCWFDTRGIFAHPIGPMLNIDITPQP